MMSSMLLLIFTTYKFFMELRMPNNRFVKLTIFIAMGGFIQDLPVSAGAEELKAGFSIDKNNLQELSEKTFEGKK